MNGTETSGETLMALVACRQPRKEELVRVVQRLRPLGIKLPETPNPGDWLDVHEEKGQTFEEYITSSPHGVTPHRNTVVILPLGDFNAPHHERILSLTAKFLMLFYGLAVRVETGISLDIIPDSAKRNRPMWGHAQILSTWILDNLLTRRLPLDAATYLCLTTSDLWPGRGWNFVFGQASTVNRVGVWSMHRLGDPVTEFSTCLRRILATAVHETGHMFSMMHCTAFSCGMCGSNHLEESDSRPIHFCPECTPKVAWATGVDLTDRARQLKEFCQRHGLADEANYYGKSYELLQ